MPIATLTKQIPVSMVLVRLLLGPAVIFAAVHHAAGWVFITCLAVATLTDIFDGIIARRLGVAFGWLRRFDTLTDVIFYICATIVVGLQFPDLIRHSAWGIIAIILLEGVSQSVSFYRFGRSAAAHTYTAKLWGLVLLAAFVSVLGFGHAGAIWYIALGVGVLVQIEGLCIMLISPVPPVDVRSIYRVVKARRSAGKSL